MANTSKDFIDIVKKMTVLELSEVIKGLEEEFGVSAAPVAAAPVAAASEAAPAAEEKTSFNIVLKSVGDNKIGVIKVVKAITGLGLKEAKDMVDSAPKTIKEDVDKKEAEDLKTQLSTAGAVVELN